MRIRNDREARNYLKGLIDQTEALIRENHDAYRKLEQKKTNINGEISSEIRKVVSDFFNKGVTHSSQSVMTILNRHKTHAELIKSDADKASLSLATTKAQREETAVKLINEKQRVANEISCDDKIAKLAISIQTVSTLNKEIDRRIYIYDKNTIFNTLSRYHKMGYHDVDKYPIIGRCFGLLSKWFHFDENFSTYKTISEINDQVDSTEASLAKDIERRTRSFETNSEIDNLTFTISELDSKIDSLRSTASRSYNPESEAYKELYDVFMSRAGCFISNSLKDLLYKYNEVRKELEVLSSEASKIRQRHESVQKTYRTVNGRSNSYNRVVEVNDISNTVITLALLDSLSNSINSMSSYSNSAYRAAEEAAAEEARRSSYSSSSSSSSSWSSSSSSSSSSSFSSSDSFGGGGGFSSSDSF
ncbi:g192 [Yersinia phage phiR1-37]|uniref:hypothetical protein n=1 Tax=Yersinia phage phiR1-37 TaxID=331278 RepID=UPI00022DBD6C|nr:hypothetical protein phiR1-37_gp192 [Yersinia phage phiR1-37]CCE26216.1 g192 [Yersinia phage phiR1-37]